MAEMRALEEFIPKISMKLYKAILIIFFSVIFQTSFVRLNGFLPVFVDLPVIVLFLLSYELSFSNTLILALIAGIFIDFFSAIGFGISALSLVIIFGANFFLRENIFKAKTRGEFIFSGFLIFFCYYPLVIILDHFLSAPSGEGFMNFLAEQKVIEEMLLNFFLGLILYYVFFIYLPGKEKSPCRRGNSFLNR